MKYVLFGIAVNAKHTVNSRTRQQLSGMAEERGRAAELLVCAMLTVCLSLTLLPTLAYADSVSGSVIWGPGDLPNGDRGAVVAAPDEFTAAAMALGYSVDDISGWSPEIKAKLSNESTGGHFYQFVQRFVDWYDSQDSNFVGELIEVVGAPFFKVAEMLYQDIWLASWSDDLGLNAALDLKAILDGGNVGGGTSSTDTYKLGLALFPLDAARGYIAGLGTSSNEHLAFVDAPATCDLVLGGNTATTVTQYRSSGYDFLAYVEGHWSGYSVKNTVYLYLIPSGSYTRSTYTGDGFSIPMLSINAGTSLKYATGQFSSGSIVGDVLTFNFSASKFFDVTRDEIYVCGYPPSTNYGGYWLLLGQNSSSTPQDPVIPPSNWPEEPSAPTPPELPEPGTDPTVEPEPWQPIINIPGFSFELNVTTEPNNDEMIDWLKKIYFELRNFHTDARGWFSEISEGFDDVVQAVNSASSQVYSQLLVINENIDSEFQTTRTYLYRLFHWLAGQLDFQNDPYNDSTVVFWLKQIWSKLGGGINTRPTDPTIEPGNWWDWLIRAIQNFLIGLAATSSDLISEFADLISQVMHQFPFSIPWDIAAILGALAAAPVTPDFTVTIPAVEGWWDAVDFHINLAAFDTAAATIRTMEKLVFVGYLIWKSKDLLEFMDVTKWFNG